MNNALLAVLVMIVILIGSALTMMSNACKSSYHAWCDPTFTARHHSKNQLPPDADHFA